VVARGLLFFSGNTGRQMLPQLVEFGWYEVSQRVEKVKLREGRIHKANDRRIKYERHNTTEQ
jgi:hypothetical protein